jgi:uncharacterized protein with GYD domain
MATFILCGKYSVEAFKGISAERTSEANNVVKKFSGEIKAMYALLGETDLIFVVDFPGIEEAMKSSVALNKLTGISFTTSQAIDVDRFDKIMAGL